MDGTPGNLANPSHQSEENTKSKMQKILDTTCHTRPPGPQCLPTQFERRLYEEKEKKVDLGPLICEKRDSVALLRKNGRHGREWMAEINRNRRLTFSGTGGRNRPE